MWRFVHEEYTIALRYIMYAVSMSIGREIIRFFLDGCFWRVIWMSISKTKSDDRLFSGLWDDGMAWFAQCVVHWASFHDVFGYLFINSGWKFPSVHRSIVSCFHFQHRTIDWWLKRNTDRILFLFRHSLTFTVCVK